MPKAEETLILYSITLMFANRDPYESKLYSDKPNILNILETCEAFKSEYSKDIAQSAFVNYRLNGIEIKEHVYELKSSSLLLDDDFEKE